VRLAARETIAVENRYLLGVTETAGSFLTEVSYLLRTGTKWRHGRIGHSRLVVTADRPFLPCTRSALKDTLLGRTFDRSDLLEGVDLPARPPGFEVIYDKQRGRAGGATRIEWSLRDFAPKQDLTACIVPAAMHVDWLEVELAQLDLARLDAAQLRLLLNFHFAKHGKTFRSKDLQRSFGARWWYRPDPRFAESRLSEHDWAAIKQLRERLRKLRQERR
jgi:hypothetical protein